MRICSAKFARNRKIEATQFQQAYCQPLKIFVFLLQFTYSNVIFHFPTKFYDQFLKLNEEDALGYCLFFLLSPFKKFRLPRPPNDVISPPGRAISPSLRNADRQLHQCGNRHWNPRFASRCHSSVHGDPFEDPTPFSATQARRILCLLIQSQSRRKIVLYALEPASNFAFAFFEA